MRWALISHPDQFIRGRLVQVPKAIPEDSAPVAVSQGWIVIGTDTEVLEQPLRDVPVQSNPRTVVDKDEEDGA